MDYQSCAGIVKALADGEDAFLAALREAPDYDGEEFANFVSRHKIMLWVAPALALDEFRGRLPAAYVDDLETDAVDRRAQVDAVATQSAEILDAYLAAGIEAVFMKGLTFGQRFYGDIHRRYQRDVDLLVRAADVERAVAALGSLGYEKDGARIGSGAVRRGMERGRATVDVHWGLRRRARRHISEEQLWTETGRVEIVGHEYATLSDENILTFHLLAMAGDIRRGASPARQSLDLYMVLRAVEAELDWDGFFARRKPQRLLQCSVNVLAVLLLVWRCAGEFPRLAQAIRQRRRMVEVADEREATALVERPRDNEENKVWYERAYPYSWRAQWARKLTVDLPHTVAKLRPAGGFELPER